jgi:cytochrome c-type biogenesis protein CcmH/NrfF
MKLLRHAIIVLALLSSASAWAVPPGALIGGALVLLVIARRRGRSESSPAGREIAVLTPAEEARLARLMRSGER